MNAPTPRGQFAHLIPAREPTLADRVNECKLAAADHSRARSDADYDAAERRAFDAENALVNELRGLGITEADARAMAIGVI